MSYYRKVKELQVIQKPQGKTETVDEVLTYPFMDVPERGIKKATCERFGIRAGLSEKDGKTVEAYYFPQFNQKGQLVGFKKQDITVPKEDEFHWTAIGSVSISHKLFGQEVCETNHRKRTMLVLTEGEWDAASVWQACTDDVKGTKYAGLEPMVASITLGTKNAVESVLRNKEFVNSFDSVAFFFDADTCTPTELKKGIMRGTEARDAVAGALLGGNLQMWTFAPAGGMKDANDYLQAGKSSLLAKLIQFEKRPYSAQKIVKASDISLEEIMAPRPEGIYVKEFPGLMEKIHGFRTREFVMVTAPSGVGKSTAVSFFSNAFIAAGERVGQIFLEETNTETMQRALASKLKVNYLKFKNNPLSVASQEDIERAYREVTQGDSIVMLGHFGSLPISELMDKIKHLHFVEGCRYIVLDHLSMVVSGADVQDERKELDMVCTELAAFCAANDVCVIAVAHLNRTAAEMFKPPKGKEGEPFWVKITKEMMRGSSALEQLAFIVVGLEPEIMPDRSRGRVRFTVLKNRPWSYLGAADVFELDDDSWEVILSQRESSGF